MFDFHFPDGCRVNVPVAIRVSSLEEYLFKSFVHFYIRLSFYC
jgi:hypothetical protein